jgi:hypothetical protein
LEWEKPFTRRGWSLIPWDYSQEDPLVPQKHYPVVINPRSSETFFLSDMQTFRDQMLEIFAGANTLQRFRFRYIRGRFLSDDGRLFDVKLSGPLRELLRELLDEAASAH